MSGQMRTVAPSIAVGFSLSLSASMRDMMPEDYFDASSISAAQICSSGRGLHFNRLFTPKM